MQELIDQIVNNPAASLGVIANLIIIESLLSVDNAAVLATMVMDLPQQEREKALKYGIWGAYIFRGIAMIFAAFLLGFWWLKPLGGMYLLWLVVDQFKDKVGYGDGGNNIFRIITLISFFLIVNTNVYFNLFGGINYVTSMFGSESNLQFQVDFFHWILMPLAILYIIYLVYSTIQLSNDEEDDGEINKSNNAVYKFFHNKIGTFWSTVILVEIMDMAFSIDNVFAAVAFTPNIILVCVGVFIGILAMRFIAQWFVTLMEKYSFLETAAFIVIAILGVKLLLSIYEHLEPQSEISHFLGSHSADIGISVLTVAIFFIPIFTSMLFNFPAKNK
jgi:YkoY family integral membrane protein